MVRRRSGPGLLRSVARTAVVSSTATAASKATSNAMNQKAMQAQQERAAATQAQQDMDQMKAQLAALQPTPTQAAPAPAAQPDLLAQLTQLAQLKEAGALTDEEFRLAKAKLLS
ncbi:SHOCT domain-containing protein (plasmid) [Kovacikia minuta CCNUW1]|uniref:SHOCT domain-containing protein n=1 Tax=Kovacikia minuta TaxID=2931930 RepID=UPI001CCDAE34|nr:SHOCT domain-containing protein [Kovacikia minuta]UBF30022.1 SHOCT domain-containing protein [Kovacikia minuta CCNUW1]